jgi:hypothetical protein
MYYADYVTALSGYLPENLANTNTEAPFISGSRYNLVLDRCIEYAELRLYRDPDLDFLATRQYATATMAAGVANITKPASLIVVETATVISPAGQQPGSTGSGRFDMERVTQQFLSFAFPAVSYEATPKQYAQVNDTTFAVGPTPDGAYVVQFYGTYRPPALSASNTSTFLTLNLPDLFVAASMIFMCGYQKKFGAMSGDPQQGMTWEQYYGELKKGAAIEEARKKFQSAGWSPMVPTPAATPPRQ